MKNFLNNGIKFTLATFILVMTFNQSALAASSQHLVIRNNSVYRITGTEGTFLVTDFAVRSGTFYTHQFSYNISNIRLYVNGAPICYGLASEHFGHENVEVIVAPDLGCYVYTS